MSVVPSESPAEESKPKVASTERPVLERPGLELPGPELPGPENVLGQNRLEQDAPPGQVSSPQDNTPRANSFSANSSSANASRSDSQHSNSASSDSQTQANAEILPPVLSTKDAVTRAYSEMINELSRHESLPLSSGPSDLQLPPNRFVLDEQEAGAVPVDNPTEPGPVQTSAAEASLINQPGPAQTNAQADTDATLAPHSAQIAESVDPTAAVDFDHDDLIGDQIVDQIGNGNAPLGAAQYTESTLFPGAHREGAQRRLKLAQDQFFADNPALMSSYGDELEYQGTPDDLSRPFTTLSKHYHARSGDHQSFSADPKEFCRTYQRMLPDGWASRLLECTPHDARVGNQRHTVLIVWRDSQRGVFIVDLFANRVRGLDAQSDYTDWEVQPQYFASLVRPRRRRSRWRRLLNNISG